MSVNVSLLGCSVPPSEMNSPVGAYPASPMTRVMRALYFWDESSAVDQYHSVLSFVLFLG